MRITFSTKALGNMKHFIIVLCHSISLEDKKLLLQYRNVLAIKDKIYNPLISKR